MALGISKCLHLLIPLVLIFSLPAGAPGMRALLSHAEEGLIWARAAQDRLSGLRLGWLAALIMRSALLEARFARQRGDTEVDGWVEW